MSARTIVTCDRCKREFDHAERYQEGVQTIEFRIGNQYDRSKPYWIIQEDWCGQCIKNAGLLSRDNIRDTHKDNPPPPPTIDDVLWETVREMTREAMTNV